MKICIECKLEQSENNFYKDKRAKDGLYIACKKCHCKYAKSWRDNNPEKTKANALNYNRQHKEERKEYIKKYYPKNKERLSSCRREYLVKNPLQYYKVLARSKLQSGIIAGKIRKRNICEICYNSPTHCHHQDYSKPFEFIELCNRCHKFLHTQLKGL
jgi:hypothetical protein